MLTSVIILMITFLIEMCLYCKYDLDKTLSLNKPKEHK